MPERFLRAVKDAARDNPKRIVLPEAHDDRILQAVDIIQDERTAVPVLVGNPDEVAQRAEELGVSLEGVEIVDMNNFPQFEEYKKALCEIRKHKGLTMEQADELLRQYNYFGTMLVQMGFVDGMISGTTYSTADTIRPALQIIGTEDRFHKVSGMFFMVLEERLLFFADCAVTIEPDAKDLADIALDTGITALQFGYKPKVAMLSFSTAGSAKHPLVDKVREATSILRHKRPDWVIEGDIQVDAALIPDICERKFPGSKMKGEANVLIFPDLQAANISYKLVERLAKAQAVGPILQGLKKPVNDLSRGCSVQDIVDLAAITCCQAQENDFEAIANKL